MQERGANARALRAFPRFSHTEVQVAGVQAAFPIPCTAARACVAWCIGDGAALAGTLPILLPRMRLQGSERIWDLRGRRRLAEP